MSTALGFIVGVGVGIALGVGAASLMTPVRLAKIRRNIARVALRQEPQVDFEAMQQ